MKNLLLVAALLCAPLLAQAQPAKPEPAKPEKAQPAAPIAPVTAKIIPAMPLMMGGAAATGEAAATEADLLIRACDRARRDYFARFSKARKEGKDFDPRKEDPEQFYKPMLRRLADAGDMTALNWCLGRSDALMPVRAGEADDRAADRAAFVADLKKLLGSEKPEHLRSAAQCAMGHADMTLSLEEALGYCETALANEKAPHAAILSNIASHFENEPGADNAAQAEKYYARALAAKPDAATEARINGALFKLRHLSVGMKAPELEGTDANGMQVKLSDYKGRVVFLEFWGFW